MPEAASLIQLNWDMVRLPLGGAFCLFGALLCIAGTVGVLRFPDIYTRLHAASVTDTGGAGFLLLGMALMAPGWLVLVKVVCILVFLVLTSVTASHALANAAHSSGVQPKIGPMCQDHVDDPEAAA